MPKPENYYKCRFCECSFLNPSLHALKCKAELIVYRIDGPQTMDERCSLCCMPQFLCSQTKWSHVQAFGNGIPQRVEMKKAVIRKAEPACNFCFDIFTTELSLMNHIAKFHKKFCKPYSLSDVNIAELAAKKSKRRKKNALKPNLSKKGRMTSCTTRQAGLAVNSNSKTRGASKLANRSRMQNGSFLAKLVRKRSTESHVIHEPTLAEKKHLKNVVCDANLAGNMNVLNNDDNLAEKGTMGSHDSEEIERLNELARTITEERSGLEEDFHRCLSCDFSAANLKNYEEHLQLCPSYPRPFVLIGMSHDNTSAQTDKSLSEREEQKELKQQTLLSKRSTSDFIASDSKLKAFASSVHLKKVEYFQCSICLAIFAKQECLLRHCDKMHYVTVNLGPTKLSCKDEHPYQCEECLTQNHDFHTHLRTAQGTSTFFSMNSKLQERVEDIHPIGHDNEEFEKCDQDDSISGLVTLEEGEGGVDMKPYKCDFCDFLTENLQNFNDHVKFCQRNSQISMEEGLVIHGNVPELSVERWHVKEEPETISVSSEHSETETSKSEVKDNPDKSMAGTGARNISQDFFKNEAEMNNVHPGETLEESTGFLSELSGKQEIEESPEETAAETSFCSIREDTVTNEAEMNVHTGELFEESQRSLSELSGKQGIEENSEETASETSFYSTRKDSFTDEAEMNVHTGDLFEESKRSLSELSGKRKIEESPEEAAAETSSFRCIREDSLTTESVISDFTCIYVNVQTGEIFEESTEPLSEPSGNQEIAENPEEFAAGTSFCSIRKDSLTNEAEMKVQTAELFEESTGSLSEHLEKRKIEGSPEESAVGKNSYSIREAQLHKSEKALSYKCSLCAAKFKKKKCMWSHLKNDHCNLSHFSCDICSKVFQTKKLLKKHIRTKELKEPDIREIRSIRENESCKPMACNFCTDLFRSLTELNSHVKKIHGEHWGLTCDYCQLKFTRKYGLGIHIRAVHLKLRPHQCEKCSMKFSLSSKLKSHIFGVHLRQRPYKCNFCSAVFAENKGRVRHETEMHKKQRDSFKCTKCAAVFVVRRSLTAHLKDVHNKKSQVQCDFCSVIFSKKSKLVHHMKISHLRKKESFAECTICSATLKGKSSLELHMKFAHGLRLIVQRPKKNSNNCKKMKFIRLKGKWRCIFCFVTFADEESLHRHVSEIHEFPCNECPERFSTKNKLLRHFDDAHGSR